MSLLRTITSVALCTAFLTACGTLQYSSIVSYGSLVNRTTAQYPMTVLDHKNGLPPAAMFTHPNHLIREYYARSDEVPTDLFNLARNLGTAQAPIGRWAAKFTHSPDTFVRHDAEQLFSKELQVLLSTNYPTQAIAVWAVANVLPYDINKGAFTLCLSSCSVSQKNLQFSFGAKDYSLQVRNAPTSIQFQPPEQVARQIEHIASSAFPPRQMMVMLVIEPVGEKATSKQLQGRLIGVRFYQPSMNLNLFAPPDPSRHIFSTAVQELTATAVENVPTKHERVAPQPPREQSDDGYRQIFIGMSKDLPEQVQQRIYATLGLRKSSTKQKRFDIDGACAGLEVEAELRDMDGDGKKEAIVWVKDDDGSNCYGSGATLWVFAPDEQGAYQSVLGWPRAGMSGLDAASLKYLPKPPGGRYPDLKIVGRGRCDVVWRWSGSRFVLFRGIPTAPGGCDK